MHHCQNVRGLLLLRIVSEACQTSTSAWCPLNGIGWLEQTAALLEITIRLADNISQGFNYYLCYFECNWASVDTTLPCEMFYPGGTCHFVASHYSPPATLIDVPVVLSTLVQNISKIVEKPAGRLLLSGYPDRP